MMNKIVCALAIWLVSFSAFAQKTIDQLGSGSALGGTEQIPMFQSANPAVTTTPNAIKTFAGTTVQTGTGATGGTCSPGATCTIAAQELVNLQTGANYAIVAGDAGKLVQLQNAGAQTPTIAAAGTAGFAAGQFWDVVNTGAGTQTITPATSTINGAATYALTQNQGVRIVSDGVNYQIQPGSGVALPVSGANGGTGVANTAKTITLGASLITTGAGAPTLAFPGTAQTYTYPAAADTLAGIGTAQTWVAIQTFTNSDIKLLGSSTGATTFTSANAGASNFTLTFPAATDTIIGKATTDTLTNKTYDTAGAGNSFSINGVAATANTGTGSVVRATTPTLVTPVLGVASGTSLAIPIIGPTADSTTALKLTKADLSTAVVTLDTTNARVGINKTPGAFDLDVNGAANVGGALTVLGTSSPTFANGTAGLYASVANGALLQGQGSANDLELLNKSGSTVMVVATGSRIAAFQSNITAVGVITVAASAASAQTSYVQNTSANAAATQVFGVGNNTSTTEFNVTVLSSAGTPANQATVNSAGPLVHSTNGTPFMTVTTGQLVAFPAITSDATHTDASVCEDTTSHAIYSGSGTLGVCLGTSSARYKNRIVDLSDGLAQIMALKPKNFFYNSDHGDNGAREQFGFLAEDMVSVLPKLVGMDSEGKPNSVDILGLVPILVKTAQEQQHKINAMERRIAALEHPFRGMAIDAMPSYPIGAWKVGTELH